MRICFFNHHEADMVEALLYLGLCQEGHEVVDVPFKPSYHGALDRYRLPPQQTWDAYGNIGAEFKDGTTAPFAWMPSLPGGAWSDDAVRGAHFDLTLCSTRQFARDALSRLGARGPLALFDGDDSSGIKTDAIAQFRPKVYFKRHLETGSPAMIDGTRILALPFSAARLVPFAGRFEYDVALLGGSNVPGGKGAYENAVRKVTSSVAFGQTDHAGMLRLVGLSRIAVAPRGHGQDVLRCYEFLGVEGPLVAVQRHSLKEAVPLVDGVHVALFSSPDELEQVLRRYLGDETLRQNVAAQGFAATRDHHTARARARYVVEETLR